VKVDIFIFDEVKKAFPLKKRDVKHLAKEVLKLEGVRESGKINIVFCDNKQITELNRDYLKKERPTDVIAFSLYEEKDMQDEDVWGEIYISVEQAKVQSEIYRTTFISELMRLVVHGALHLAGWDDSSDVLREKMRLREDFYLQKSGLI